MFDKAFFFSDQAYWVITLAVVLAIFAFANRGYTEFYRELVYEWTLDEAQRGKTISDISAAARPAAMVLLLDALVSVSTAIFELTTHQVILGNLGLLVAVVTMVILDLVMANGHFRLSNFLVIVMFIVGMCALLAFFAAGAIDLVLPTIPVLLYLGIRWFLVSQLMRYIVILPDD